MIVDMAVRGYRRGFGTYPKLAQAFIKRVYPMTSGCLKKITRGKSRVEGYFYHGCIFGMLLLVQCYNTL